MNKQIAILGASGYTGAELVRLVHAHPNMDIAALAADRKAGQPMASVFPHLGHLDLLIWLRLRILIIPNIDLVFCGLPHGVAHDFVRTVPDHVKIVDLSPDFRLEDGEAYEKCMAGRTRRWTYRVRPFLDCQKSIGMRLSPHGSPRTLGVCSHVFAASYSCTYGRHD